MSAEKTENEMTRMLRDADPLDHEPGLTAAERAQIRLVVLSRVPEEASSLWRRLSPALSVAVLLAIALGLAWSPSIVDSPVAAPSSPLSAATSMTSSPAGLGLQRAGNSLESRKIQFETPGGTLVVWVLDPNFPS